MLLNLNYHSNFTMILLFDHDIVYQIELVILLDILLKLDKKKATYRTRKVNNRFIQSSKNEWLKAGK